MKVHPQKTTWERIKRGIAGAAFRAPRYVVVMDMVDRAADSLDWQRVAQLIEELNRRGIATDMSRHWLGIAYLKLGRWQDALNQYESIGGPLKEPDSEARRILNHALAYYRLGDSGTCRTMLERGIGPGWPSLDRQKAERILAEIASTG